MNTTVADLALFTNQLLSIAEPNPRQNKPMTNQPYALPTLNDKICKKFNVSMQSNKDSRYKKKIKNKKI
jgi:hypothetical protein